MASSLGNVVGALVLILLLPHVVEISMGVGAWEYSCSASGRDDQRLHFGRTSLRVGLRG